MRHAGTAARRAILAAPPDGDPLVIDRLRMAERIGDQYGATPRDVLIRHVSVPSMDGAVVADEVARLLRLGFE